MCVQVVHKRSGEQVSRASLMPSAIPFMVELHRYYETDSAVYLVLQHATGGRFWSYVSGYLAQAPQCHLLDALINDSHERQLRTFNRPASHLESRDATGVYCWAVSSRTATKHEANSYFGLLAFQSRVMQDSVELCHGKLRAISNIHRFTNNIVLSKTAIRGTESVSLVIFL